VLTTLAVVAFVGVVRRGGRRPHPLLLRTGQVVLGGALLWLGVQLAFGRDHVTHAGLLPVPVGIPLGIILNGAVLGLLYALLAFGLILVYRAQRLVNFAQAGLGAVPAVTALLLVTNRGLPYPLAVALLVVGSLAGGAAVEAGVMSRFRTTPRLLATVATIGVAQLLLLVELFLPRWIGGTALTPTTFPTPFSDLRVVIGGVVFSGDYLAILVIAVAMMAALGAFLRFTRTGVAIRASAENADRASGLGIPVRRLSIVVWAVAGLCSGVAVFLQAPVIGLPLGGSVSPIVLLYGLTAAVVARFESMPMALLAGVGIGVIEQSSFAGTNKPDLAGALMLPLVLVALLAQRRQLSRAFDTGVSSFRALQEVRPVPAVLRRLPEVTRARDGAVLAVLALAVGAPLVLGEARSGFGSLVLIYAMVGLSVVVLSGWAGQISLGQFGFAGVGAVVAGSLTTRLHADFFLTLGGAVLAGALVALLIGLPALRVPGLFLAVVTLAFAAFVQFVALNRDLAGGLLPPDGAQVGRPILYGVIDTSGQRAFYWLCLTLLLLVYLLVRSLGRTRSGRLFVAVRDNPRAAASYGVDTTRAKLAAFAVSGGIAALGGALLAFQQQAVDQETYGLTVSLDVFMFTVVGGLTTPAGAALGAVYFEGVRLLGPALGIPHLEVLATGVGLLALLLLLPGGLASGVFRLRDDWLRRVAERQQIDVPSLRRDPLPEPAAESAAAATAQPDALLTVSGLEVEYDGVQVLFGIDLTVGRGEMVALLGTNGAGKSTVLRAISGISAPSGGCIDFDGQDITGQGAAAIARAGIVQVPGGKAVFPTLTVDEHLDLAGWAVPAEEAAAQRRVVLERFPRLAERGSQLAGNLSGGEQQQLALGMALIQQPRLLLIDELSLGLAPAVVADLVQMLREIHARGTSVVLVEQSVNVALTLADRAYFLEKGQVRFDGPTRELLDRRDVLRAVFLPDSPAPDPVAQVTERAAGHALTAVPAIEAVGVSKAFGGIRAVQDVHLAVAPGEVVGLIGPNGAGKTTAFDLLSGFLLPDSGRVRLGGRDVTSLRPAARAELGLGRCFQDARIFPSLTVAQNLAAALERHVPVRDHLAGALALPAIREQEADLAWSVADLVELMGLGGYRDAFVSELSTGTRRLVELAMAIGHDADVLLLDEPSSGVAQREVEALVPLLQRIRTDTGCAMVLVEHDIPLVSAVSDRLVAFETGRVIATGTPAEVLADAQVVASYLGQEEAAVQRSGRRSPAEVAG
jgi:ABC-type branched-subunit amino acid transport system ATPase component/ABC-type branched-subunit amino acid transport system permease subunit